MPYKIVIDVGQVAQRYIFVVRSWRDTRKLPINGASAPSQLLDKALPNVAQLLNLTLVDRIDKRTPKRKSQYYYYEITKTIKQAAVVVVVCIPDPETNYVSPNVIYECGLAHSLGKPTVMLTVTEFNAPVEISDLAGREFVYVSREQSLETQTYLIKGAIEIAQRNSLPEGVIDRETYKQGIDLLLYGDDNKNKRVFEISAEIEQSFTQLRQGAIAKLERLQTQLKDANPEREANRIAQTLNELKRELQEFEVNHDCLIDKVILDFDDKLAKIESLFGEEQASEMEAEYKSAITRIKDHLREYNRECRKLSASIRPIRSTFEEPESQQQIRMIMSDSLWSLNLIIGSIIKRCDSLKQLCFTQYFGQWEG